MLLLLGVGLSMDSFAISITNGMCRRVPFWKNALSSGVAFGVSQGAMPLIGYYAGYLFADLIERFDHWVALVLLAIIGGKMVVEAVRERAEPDGCEVGVVFSYKTLAVQAVATSIDALAVGVSLGVMQANIWLAVCAIAVTTFIMSFFGVLVGSRFGGLLKDKAEILGGVILILIGIKIFLEHTGIL